MNTHDRTLALLIVEHLESVSASKKICKSMSNCPCEVDNCGECGYWHNCHHVSISDVTLLAFIKSLLP